MCSRGICGFRGLWQHVGGLRVLGVGGGSRAGCCAVGDCGGLREDIGCLWGLLGDIEEIWSLEGF